MVKAENSKIKIIETFEFFENFLEIFISNLFNQNFLNSLYIYQALFDVCN